MSKYLFVFFTMITLNLQSQNFVTVDSIVNKYPNSFNKPEKLAELIKRDFESEKDKVRAIYIWIINNVSYDPKEYGLYSYKYKDNNEKINKEKKYHSKLSKRVISKNIAVCEGYSSLFKKLCDLLDITSYIIEGSAKVDISDIGKRFNYNHTWNIVEINNVRYLIDATWGAGSYTSSFKKAPTDYYFFTNPQLFIKNHYPKDYSYTLLDEVIDKKTFFSTPIIYMNSMKYNDIITPKEGILRVDNSDSNIISFKIFWNKEVNNINYLIGRKNSLVQKFKFDNNVLEFSIEIKNTDKKLKELYIYIDNKPCLGYGIK